MKENNSKKEKREEKSKERNTKKISKKILTYLLFTVVIILISLVSFVGIYTKNMNKMENIIPNYTLGSDLYGSRNLVIKVDDSTKTKKYDAEGNEITEEDSSNSENEEKTEVAETKEIPVNDESLLTLENYKKVKEIIEKRLKYVNIGYYEIKLNEADGTISMVIPEDSNTDTVTQYCATKGEFALTDAENGDLLLKNSDIQNAKVQYNTTSSGTSVYLSIQFNKDATEKLKEISKTYIKSEDAEGKDTSKKVEMKLDDQTIISTYFEEEIKDGIISLTLGTSSTESEIQSYLTQGTNLAVFFNTESLPITYKIDVNRFTYSDITSNELKNVCIAATVIFGILLLIMIIKFRSRGFIAAIANIGFVALLLLIIRYTNVDVTLTGLTMIAIVTLVEYGIVFKVLKDFFKKDIDKETRDSNVKKTITKQFELLMIIAVIAVVFSVCGWEMLYSAGMILFWGIIIMVIYNLISLRLILIKESENK